MKFPDNPIALRLSHLFKYLTCGNYGRKEKHTTVLHFWRAKQDAKGGGKGGFLPRLPSRVSFRVPLTHDSRDSLKWRSCSRHTRDFTRANGEISRRLTKPQSMHTAHLPCSFDIGCSSVGIKDSRICSI